MARHEINYLDGTTDTVTAEGVEYDTEAGDYTFYADKQVVALAPVINVRSVLRRDEESVKDGTTGGDQETSVPVTISGAARATRIGIIPAKDTQTGIIGKIYIGGTNLDAHIEAIVDDHLNKEGR